MVVYGFLFNMGSGSIFGDFWKTAYFYGGIISVLFALIGSISYVGAYLHDVSHSLRLPDPQLLQDHLHGSFSPEVPAYFLSAAPRHF